MHFNKATIAIFAITISNVFAAPVIEAEAFEKRDVASSLSTVANAFKSATGTSITALNAGLSQVADAASASATVVANANVNANLAQIASAVSTAANGIVQSLEGATKTITTSEALSLESSVTTIENAANSILAAIKVAEKDLKKESLSEFSSAEGQAQVITGSINAIGNSLKTYLGAVTVTGSNGGSSAISAALSAVSSILNNLLGL